MTQIKTQMDKKPANVRVYERLYQMIQDGTFPVGTKLPPEPKLAKMLEVSRMTLRQALSLLNDDGLIMKIQGSGNYVIDRDHHSISGLDQMGHPLKKGSKIEFDQMETDLYIEPSNDYSRKLLKINTPVVIAVHTWYRSKGKLIAYTFGVAAVETISKYQLDLNDKEQIIHFFGEEVYEKAERSQIRIYPTSAGETIVEEFAQKGETVAMIQEMLYGDELYPIIYNKHYILADLATFEINIKKQ